MLILMQKSWKLHNPYCHNVQISLFPLWWACFATSYEMRFCLGYFCHAQNWISQISDFFLKESHPLKGIVSSLLIMSNMAIQVVEFSSGGIKLERFLPKNQHAQRKFLNFKHWCDGELSKSAKIWLSKYFIEEYQILQFLIFTFFDDINL